MTTLIIVLVVLVVLVLIGLAMAIRIVRQYEQASCTVRPTGRPARTRAAVHHPFRRRPAPCLAAHRHDADPVAGHHHP